MKAIVIFIGIFLFSKGICFGVSPDLWQVQTMGYQGAMSAGFGFKTASWHTIIPNIGITPRANNGKNIVQLNIQNRFALASSLLQNSEIEYYMGLTLLYGLDQDLFLILPNHYPKSYYPPTALRASIEAGIRYTIDKPWSFTCHYSLLDTEIAPLFSQGNPFRNQTQFGSWLFGIAHSL